MSTTHEGKLADLNNRIATIDANLKQLDEAFIDAASDFDGTNGKEALRKAETIEQKVSALRRERALALAAQAKVHEQQQHEQAEAEQQERHEREIEARKLADSVAAINVRIDEGLKALVNLFDQRANLLHALSNTNIGNSQWVNKLNTRPCATRAAAASGLGKFISLENVAVSSLQPMASANPQLLGIGVNGSGNGSRPPRVKLDDDGAGVNP